MVSGPNAEYICNLHQSPHGEMTCFRIFVNNNSYGLELH